jgi:hypothetical protein
MNKIKQVSITVSPRDLVSNSLVFLEIINFTDGIKTLKY